MLNSIFHLQQKTHAYHQMKDDVPEDVKKRRLQEIIATFYSFVGGRNKRLVGTHQLVLVEGVRDRNLHSTILKFEFSNLFCVIKSLLHIIIIMM